MSKLEFSALNLMGAVLHSAASIGNKIFTVAGVVKGVRPV